MTMTTQIRRNRLARLFGLQACTASLGESITDLNNPFAGFVDDLLLPQNAKRRKKEEEEPEEDTRQGEEVGATLGDV